MSSDESLFEWVVLQQGSLPLRPDDTFDPFTEHRCTTTLIFRRSGHGGALDGVLVDPSFDPDGLRQAHQRLGENGLSFDRLGLVHVTHQHHDHLPVRLPAGSPGGWRLYDPLGPGALAGLEPLWLNGHCPGSVGLLFHSAGGPVAVVGDAVLGPDWLSAWKVYGPNGYDRQQVVQHWRDVATIVGRARVIVPGHSGPIAVTGALVEELARTFETRAEFASDCPEVRSALLSRLQDRSPP